MAEERNVGLARAPETAGDTDATKAELQRRMEEARESITQTVTEIKETVVNQYQQVRESINDTLDWREQYRRRPLPFTLGAFGVGLCLGYSVAGAFGGHADEDEERGYADEEESFDRIERGFDRLREPRRPYAAGPVLGGAPSSFRAAGSSEYGAEESYAAADVGPDTRPSYSSGYQAPTAPPPEASFAGLASSGGQAAQAEEPKGPGLFERFKETKAYDRLQEELSTLGDRAIEELSRTARNVVVPALLGKLKDLIGIDLSTQREVAQRSRLEHQTAQTNAAVAETDEQQTTSGRAAGGATGGSAAYATGGKSS
ncbi:MAG: hypothetical protein M3416_15745 [Acidobacteriota bacterium]|nr:hypothetical protein [Acidobacteriota bacterium]